MSPRQDVSEERRSQILDAATDVFARLGFGKARMDDIVKQSGLSKGALYWYFKSKDDIITALMGGLFERELVAARDQLTLDRPATERLMQLAHDAVIDLKHMTKLMPVMYEFYSVALRNKRIRKALSNYLNSYMEVLDPIIQQGIEAGEFRAADPREAALAISAILEGTILLWVLDPNTVKLDIHIESSVRLLLDGLKVPSKKSGK